MKNQCIYCGTTNDLSKSDIIPDALTNAKITNPNVCRIEHNNKFSDLFESEVIRELALLTNKLNVKSNKSNKYPSYPIKVNIKGIEYNTKISAEIELFSNRKLRSVDERFLFGPIEEIKKIKEANDQNITQVDINQIEIEGKVRINFSVFFSKSMYRMMAKIAFEWYCQQNDINGKINAFETIIQFITNGIGSNIVTIVGNEELYSALKMVTNFGSHTLFSYVAKDGSVNILVSLFGVAIYNIKICDSIIPEYRNNVIFQELQLDTKRVQFKFETFEHFMHDFYNKLTEVEFGNEIKVMTLKNTTDMLIHYQVFYGKNYSLFQNNLQSVTEPNEKTKGLVIKNIEEILQSFTITLRGLKKFVEEYFKNFDEEIKLNPKSTNKKDIFMFYLLFIVGRSNGSVKNFYNLNKFIKEKFSSETIVINDEKIYELREKIFSVVDYSNFILKGAKMINSWVYE